MKLLHSLYLLAALTLQLLAAPFTPNPDDFEDASAEQRWIPTLAVWQVGTPSVVGPATAHGGAKCLATKIDGNYPNFVNSRAESQSFDVPAANLNPRLRFWQWISVSNDVGQVQIKRSGGSWEPLSPDTDILNTGGGVWTRSGYDLRGFAGETVQLGFQFNAGGDGSTGPGWYIDDISILTGDIAVPIIDDFEDVEVTDRWVATNGIWEIGHPDNFGPSGGHAASANCLATVLNADYPAKADSIAVGPEVSIPAAEFNPRLVFYHWFKIPNDTAIVRVTEDNGLTWTDLSPTISGDSGGWTIAGYPLTNQANKTVRFGFYFNSGSDGSVGNGWYIDEVQIISDAPQPPSASTLPAIDLARTAATLRGSVVTNGQETSAWFEYGLDSELGGATKTAPMALGDAPGTLSVSKRVGGLVPRQRYYFRTVAKNTTGTTKGNILSFDTSPPSATTLVAIEVADTSAKLRADINPSGLPTMAHFEYGTDPQLAGALSTPDQAVTATRRITATITGLQRETTYYFRAVATNSVDSNEGAILSLTTTAQVDKLAQSDDQVTGEPVGTVFFEFGTPAVDAGLVGGLAQLRGADGALQKPVLFGGLAGPGTGAVLERTGAVLPGSQVGNMVETITTLGDPTFAGAGASYGFAGQTRLMQVASSSVPHERWLPGAQLRLPASPRANLGIPSTSPVLNLFAKLATGGLHRVAGVGKAAGNISGGKFKKFGAFGLPRGRVGLVYGADLSGVPKGSEQTVWREKTDGSGSDMVLRTGAAGTLVEGKTLSKLVYAAPVTNGNEQRRAFARDGGVVANATFDDGSGTKTSGIVRVAADGTPDIAMDTNDDVLNEIGVVLADYKFTAIGTPASASAKKYAAFCKALQQAAAGVVPKTQQAIYASFDGVNRSLIASRGYTNPADRFLRDDSLSALGHPQMGEAGFVAFLSSLAGKGAVPGKNKIIMGTALAGQLTGFARLGDPAPGTAAKVVFAQFKSMVVTDTNPARVVFTATLSGPGVTPANNLGLWASDEAGDMKLLLRSSQVLKLDDPNDDADKSIFVRSFVALQPPSSSKGQGRSTDDGAVGTVAVRATLSTGQKGVLRLPLP